MCNTIWVKTIWLTWIYHLICYKFAEKKSIAYRDDLIQVDFYNQRNKGFPSITPIGKIPLSAGESRRQRNVPDTPIPQETMVKFPPLYYYICV